MLYTFFSFVVMHFAIPLQNVRFDKEVYHRCVDAAFVMAALLTGQFSSKTRLESLRFFWELASGSLVNGVMDPHN